MPSRAPSGRDGPRESPRSFQGTPAPAPAAPSRRPCADPSRAYASASPPPARQEGPGGEAEREGAGPAPPRAEADEAGAPRAELECARGNEPDAPTTAAGSAAR